MELRSPPLRRSARLSAKATPLTRQAIESAVVEPPGPEIESSEDSAATNLLSSFMGNTGNSFDVNDNDPPPEHPEDNSEDNSAPVLSPQLKLTYKVSPPNQTRVPAPRPLSRSSVERLTSKAMVRVRSTKPLTIPITPVSRLMQRLGEKKYSTMGPESREEKTRLVQGGAIDTVSSQGGDGDHPRLLTIPRSPRLMTKARAMSTTRSRPRGDPPLEQNELMVTRSLSTVRRASGHRPFPVYNSDMQHSNEAFVSTRRSSRGIRATHESHEEPPAPRREHVLTVPVSPKISKPRAVSAPPKRYTHSMLSIYQ